VKLQKFRNGFSRIVTGIGYVGLVFMFAMVVIVAVDVVGRKVSGGSMRIRGSNELTQFFMIIVCSLGIPVLQIKKGHIWVPLFVDRFPYRFRCFWVFGISVVETGVIAMLCLGAYNKVADLITTGRPTDVLNIPQWIFAVVMVVAFVEYFILSLIDTIQYLIDGVKNEPPKPEEKGWTEDEVKGV